MEHVDTFQSPRSSCTMQDLGLRPGSQHFLPVLRRDVPDYKKFLSSRECIRNVCPDMKPKDDFILIQRTSQTAPAWTTGRTYVCTSDEAEAQSCYNTYLPIHRVELPPTFGALEPSRGVCACVLVASWVCTHKAYNYYLNTLVHSLALILFFGESRPVIS